MGCFDTLLWDYNTQTIPWQQKEDRYQVDKRQCPTWRKYTIHKSDSRHSNLSIWQGKVVKSQRNAFTDHWPVCGRNHFLIDMCNTIDDSLKGPWWCKTLDNVSGQHFTDFLSSKHYAILDRLMYGCSEKKHVSAVCVNISAWTVQYVVIIHENIILHKGLFWRLWTIVNNYLVHVFMYLRQCVYLTFN